MSLWSETVRLPDRPPLDGDLSADVCIVGSGLAGLTCAYLLGLAGRSVVVLDEGPVGGCPSAFTTAQLTSVLGHRYCEFEHLHGADGARLIAASHMAAIDRVEAIVRDEGLFCDFERLPGFLFQPPGRGTALLGRELAAARRAGLDVEWEERAPCGGFDSGPCLRFDDQAQLHPLRYLAGLLDRVEATGARLAGGTPVEAIDDGDPARVRAGGHVVEAGAVIVTGERALTDHHRLRRRLTAYTTCVLGALVPDGQLERALYWDTDFHPDHSLRLQCVPGGTLLLVRGEDHRPVSPHDRDGRHARLEAWARERFPALGPVRHAWSGEVLESTDGLAFIGRAPGAGHVYVVAGDTSHVLTQATIAGQLLTELITEGSSPWAALYEPAREPAAAIVSAGRGRLRSADFGRAALSRLPSSGAA